MKKRESAYCCTPAAGRAAWGAAGKAVPIGMVKRGERVRTKVVPNAWASTLLPEIKAHVLPEAQVFTDVFLSYDRLSAMGFRHKSVAHSRQVYVSGKDIHTNTIEGFWSQLKRSIDGTSHHVTARHLQGYADKYGFRYSHRNDEEPMFKTMLAKVSRCTTLA